MYSMLVSVGYQDCENKSMYKTNQDVANHYGHRIHNHKKVREMFWTFLWLSKKNPSMYL